MTSVILQGVFDVNTILGDPQDSVKRTVVSDKTWNQLSGTWGNMGIRVTTFDVEQVLNGDFIVDLTLQGSLVVTLLNGEFDVGLTLQGAAGDGTVTVVGQSFAIYQGESRNVTIKVVDGSGNPFNLTGSTITWTVTDKWAKTILTKTATGDANGNITFTITHVDTQGLASGTYQHFTQVTDAQGNVGVVTSGNLTVLEQ